jgi:fatty-acid desaturase
MRNAELHISGSRRHKLDIKWGNSLLILVTHTGAIAAFFFWSWTALITAVLLYWIAGSLGIGMGYHRLLTHRAFRVPKAVEYFLVTCGTLAAEGGPIQWVATHRIHHAHTDQKGDPHTPRDGGWWAHVGWVLKGTGQDHDRATLERYAPDLLKDQFYVVLSRWFYLPQFLLAIALFAFGGWGVMLWGICLRVTLGLHATWLVNSATHIWGRQRFETGEDSRNSWWVALLTFGEGWHNNHHAHPTSARHGLKWYEIDFNWWSISLLRLVGLARGIKRVHFDNAITGWLLVTSDAKPKR